MNINFSQSGLVKTARKILSHRMTVLVMLVCCMVAGKSYAHTVDNFTNCNSFCVGQNVTVTVKLSATNNNTKYNWQYRDNSNTWKCFSNGTNVINGVSFSVSNATATGTKSQLSITISNAKMALDGVDIRLLMADNGSPCNNPSYATWGSNKSQELNIVTNCQSIAGLCHTGCNNNCNHTTCGHSNCAHNSCNNDCNHTNCGHPNCGKHTSCNNNCNHTTCGHPNCSHNSCNNNCNHTNCGHPNCGHNNCHNDCNHTNCGHPNCGHNSCHNDCDHNNCGHPNCGKHTSCRNNCNHTNCGHPNCSHNSCNNNCNHTGCGHPNCGHNSCHNDCNHTGCGHPNCGHNSCHNDCNHTNCGHSNCSHNSCNYNCNHTGCGHTKCGRLRLGNQVWNDRDGDGKRDPNEPGIGGVTISLYRDNNADNRPDGGPIATTMTDQNGRYLFDNLTPGRYIASMPILLGYQQSPNRTTGGIVGAETSGCCSLTPDSDIDNDNNLVRLVGPNGPGGVVYTNAITLAGGTEPTNDGDDSNGNMTFDLAECGNGWIGDFVWDDLNGNGIQDAGEPGINGVTVTLTFPDGTTATDVTHTYNAANNSNAPEFDGYYDFGSLGGGTYKVTFSTPAGYHPSPSNRGGNDAKDSDPVNGSTTVTIAPNQSDFTIDAGFTKANVCVANSCVQWKFNTYPCAPNKFVWFNSTLKVTGRTSSPTTIFINNGTVKFKVNGTNYNLQVPKSQVTFSNTVTAPKTTFNAGSQTWEIEVPYNTNGDVFAGGITFPVPASGLPANINPVTWCADFSSTSPGLSVKWEWGAAIYSSFSTNYNNLVVATTDGANQAGTPVAYKNKLQPGGTGTGGNNCTGSKAPFGTVTPCANPTVSLGNFVWNDYDGSGLKDPDEYGLPGITVRLYRAGAPGVYLPKGEAIATTVTDSRGYYHFDNLAPGSYYTSMTIPVGYTRSPNSQTTTGETPNNDIDNDNNLRFPENATMPGQELYTAPIELTVGGEPGVAADGDGTSSNNTLDLAVCGNFWIGNFVWDDANGNGIQDAGEKGINGVKVNILFPDGVTTASTTTLTYGSDSQHPSVDADGYYDFKNLGPGTYKLTFELPAGYRPSPAKQGGVDSTDSDPVNGTVTVVLVDRSNHNIDAGFTKKALDCAGSTTAAGYYFGGFEAGTDNFSNNTGKSDFNNNSLPNVGSYKVVQNVSQLGGSGYYNITPRTGNYFLAARTTADVTDRIWYTKLNVTPGQTISFCINARLLKAASYSTPTYLALYAGGQQLVKNKVINGWNAICGTYTVPAGVTSIELSVRDPKKGCFFVAIDDICIENAKTLSLGNYVWNDANEDGIRNAGEFGIAGVKVSLYREDPNNPNQPDDDEPIATTTTNLQGFYNFSNLSEGRYIVSIPVLPGFAPSAVSEADVNNDVDNDNNAVNLVGDELFSNAIELTEGGEPANDGDGTNGNNTLDMALSGNLSIGNFVWNDANSNGIQDNNEKGINGVEVKIVYPDGTIATTVTGNNPASPSIDNDGYYEFPNLGPGRYLLYFQTPQGLTPTTPNQGNNSLDSDPIFGFVLVTLTDQSNNDVDAGFTNRHTGCHNNCNHEDCGHSYCSHNSCHNNCNHTSCGHPNCSHNSCNNDCNHTNCGHANCGSNTRRSSTPPPATKCSMKVLLQANDPLCYGHRTGKIVSTVSGNTGALTYTWSNGSTGTELLNAGAGTYTLTVTDNQTGCQATSDPVQLTNPTKMVAKISSPSTKGYNMCKDGTNGMIALDVTGGKGAYTYAWSNGSTAATLQGVSAGKYAVVIKDENGCSAKAETTLREALNPLQVEPVVRQVTCTNPTGSVQLKVAGGVAPYSFEWNTKATSSEVKDLAPGKYTVVVKDAMGCEVNKVVEVADHQLVVKLNASTSTLFDEQSSATLNAEVKGGVAPYTYKWASNQTLKAEAEGTATVSPSVNTDYALTVTDANGCTASASTSMKVVKDASMQKKPTPEVFVERGLKVTPNPSDGVFTVWLNGFETGKLAVRIVDVNGKEINTRQVEVAGKQHAVPFNLSHLPKGIYFVNVVAPEGTFQEKVVIK